MTGTTNSTVPTGSTANRTVYRTCPLCEATCGLEITVGPGEQVVRIRGDRDDVFSHGFICPKGSTLKQLHEDPDRLRRPLVRRNGEHVEVSWEEAWDAVAAGLGRVIERHGRGALAVYGGNPGAHNLGSMLYNSVVYRSMGSHNKFSASTVDQIPKHVAGGYMFGTPQSIPVPDIDHTDYLVLLGANPYESNGSLCTAPDFPGRIQGVRARGGKVVTIDPRRTKTADNSDQWIAVKPGTDGLLLAAVLNVLFTEGLARPEARLAQITDGIDDLRAAVGPHTPESVEPATGVSASVIRTLAREIAAAPTAAVYGRIGVNAVEFGTLNAWLIDAINMVTGNLDRRGGAMFTTPATGSATTRGQAGKGKGFSIGRGHSRVSKKPEAMGEYPVAILAEEITTPGERVHLPVGQPGHVHPARQAARRGPRFARFHGVGRHLPERDVAPRRRDPARAHCTAEGALRRRSVRVCSAQRGQLQRARLPARGRPARRMGDPREARCDPPGTRRNNRTAGDR
jgi:anaerobic selenocysteine-containing dehydrogenase